MKTYNPYRLFVGSFIPDWLSERTEISQGAKLCFARLSQHAGKDGECYPSVAILAKELGVKIRMAHKYLAELTRNNLILIEKLPNGGNRNSYKFQRHKWMEGRDMHYGAGPGVHYSAGRDMHYGAGPIYKRKILKDNNIKSLSVGGKWVHPLVSCDDKKTVEGHRKEIMAYLDKNWPLTGNIPDSVREYRMQMRKYCLRINGLEE